AVEDLQRKAPYSKLLSDLWSHIKEEERTLYRRFEGHVLAWGLGRNGELGLGDNLTTRRTPTVISRGLRGVSVKNVVAGAAHVLCLSMDGNVYSWGRGKDGRLGHGDYLDRWEPCTVELLRGEKVSLVAAGKAHSLAVALPQTVYTWGRG
ncbi:unnamed protein product, partial [Choristocarpus tenellus]